MLPSALGWHGDLAAREEGPRFCSRRALPPVDEPNISLASAASRRSSRPLHAATTTRQLNMD